MVPLLVQEPLTTRMRSYLKDDPLVITWWGTEVECVSAIARLEREEKLDQESVPRALQRLAELVQSWHEIRPGRNLRELAKRLLRVHSLRTGDALQLAAALVAVEHPSSLQMVCLDDHLATAANREGFAVLS